MKSVKIAIVGTGRVARSNYIPYLARQKHVVLSYYSRTRNTAEVCAKEHGGTVARSLEELVAGNPDAVLVLTHETQRLDVATALVALRPKRLFFEKPLVARHGQGAVCEQDFLDARTLLEAARAAGIETAMMFNYRFFELSRRVRQTVADRAFGKLLQASFFANYACWSHCLDLVRVWGGRAVRVSALSGSTEYVSAASTGFDLGVAFTLESGCTGTILGSSRPDFGAPLYMATLNFEGGLIRLCDLDGAMDVYPAGATYAESLSLMANASRWNQYAASFEKALEAYLASIADGRTPPVPGVAGLEELQFEAAMRRSAASGRAVDVQAEFSLDGFPAQEAASCAG